MIRSGVRYSIWCLLLFAITTAPARAQSIILYDAALGGTPDTQSMIFQGLGGSQSAANGATTLNTSLNMSVRAGYTAKPGVLPSLDRTTGFRIQFTTQLTTENHASATSDKNNDGIDDRAGFSVIALASDQRGIELGFWADRIWAQAGGGPGDGALFTQLEGAAIDTTIARTYDLELYGASYTLRSGDQLILSGPLRNYSAAGTPYNLSNFVFFGDNTTSASAIVQIGSIALIPMSQRYRVELPLIIRS